MARPTIDRRWLPLNALRAFEGVAKHSSFTAAANALLISQSALSRHVIALEKLIGTQLFERKPHALVLTKAGQHLLPAVFRPRRSAHDALQVLIDESWQGRRWVVETDVASCFESISHCELIQAIEERVCDQAILSLVRMLLRAGVMEGGSLRRSTSGTAQGGPLSPLLCNVYLHRLDRRGRQPSMACWSATPTTRS